MADPGGGPLPAPAAFDESMKTAARDELRVNRAARGAKWVTGSYWATEAEWARANAGEEIGITLDDRPACDVEACGVKMQFHRVCWCATWGAADGRRRPHADEATPAQFRRLMARDAGRISGDAPDAPGVVPEPGWSDYPGRARCRSSVCVLTKPSMTWGRVMTSFLATKASISPSPVCR